MLPMTATHNRGGLISNHFSSRFAHLPSNTRWTTKRMNMTRNGSPCLTVLSEHTKLTRSSHFDSHAVTMQRKRHSVRCRLTRCFRRSGSVRNQSDLLMDKSIYKHEWIDISSNRMFFDPPALPNDNTTHAYVMASVALSWPKSSLTSSLDPPWGTPEIRA